MKADADGATDIRDLSELYRKIHLIQENTGGIEGETIGMALGSRYPKFIPGIYTLSSHTFKTTDSSEMEKVSDCSEIVTFDLCIYFTKDKIIFRLIVIAMYWVY